MKKPIRICSLASLAWPLLALASSAQVTPAPAPTAGVEAAPATSLLRLRSGGVLWGHVVEHSPELLRFKRIDTGGVVSLPWSLLDPVEEAELRLLYGYVELAAEQLLVDAERFKLHDGSEMLGVVDGRDSNFIWIKNVDGRIPIPLQNFQGSPARVQAPALEIYTRQELYLAKQAELGSALVAAGRPGAEAHDQLAQYCERLFDYTHALEHYTYARDLDGSLDPERIAASLERARLKAEQQEQLDFLSTIELNSARQRFDRALAGLELFEERFPDSPLREDWSKLQERVKKAQLAAVRESVRLRVYSWATRLARQAVRDHKDYAGVLAYLEDDMQQALFEGVQSDLIKLAPGIQVEEIKQIWLQRKFSGARPATYGVGTWLLGKERAQKTYKKEEPKDEKPKRSSKAEERRQLEDRIAKYIKNQQLTRKSQARSAKSDEEKEEHFWSAWNYTSRWHWALAYFVENSELFKITSVTYSRCRECGGSGVLDTFNLVGGGKNAKRGSVIAPCPTCQTLGIVRRFRYR